MHKSRGLTLVELIITMLVAATLAFTTFFVFRTILGTWSKEQGTLVASMRLDAGLERLARELREATSAQSTTNYNEIRMSNDGSTFFIYYLYNASDSYVPPPAFDQTTYDLMRAELSGGIGSTFTYGAGVVLVSDVVAPPTSSLSLSGNRYIADLQVQTEGPNAHARIEVRPRNL